MTTKVELSALSSALPQGLAALVTRESFESRAGLIPSTLALAGLQAKEFWSFRTAGRSAAVRLDMGAELKVRELGAADATGLAAQMLDCARRLASFSEEEVSVVDITAFRREELLVLLRMLHHVRPSGRGIRFFYLPAKEYSSSWLSRGVVECHSVVGFPGSLVPGRPDHLVLMLGFELDRARALIEFYEPARISLGRGSAGGSISPEFYLRNLDVFNAFLTYALPSASVEFEFFPDDALSTAAAIKRVLDAAGECNHLVAPLNNKITTLGAGAVALDRPDVQLVYAPASEYNESEYSKPSDYVFDISAEDLFSGITAAPGK